MTTIQRRPLMEHPAYRPVYSLEPSTNEVAVGLRVLDKIRVECDLDMGDCIDIRPHTLGRMCCQAGYRIRAARLLLNSYILSQASIEIAMPRRMRRLIENTHSRLGELLPALSMAQEFLYSYMN